MSPPGPTPAVPCRLCALTRSASQALRLLLLPRVLAFGGAVAVLALMAPSGIPTPKRPPANPASAEALSGAGAASAAASSATPAAVPGQVLTTTTTVTTVVTTSGPLAASAPAANAGVAGTTSALSPPGAPSGPSSAADTAPARAATPARAAVGVATDRAQGGTPDASGARRGEGAQPGAKEATAASPAAAGTALQPLRFRGVATLPSARAGTRWGPHTVLEQGQPPYTLRFVGGKPAWMDEPEGGALAGTPSKPETVVFTLEGSSRDDPARVLTQTFRVQVLAAARPGAPVAPPRLTEVRPAEAASAPPAERDVPVTWRLDAADLQALLKALQPAAADGDALKAELRWMMQSLRAVLSADGDVARPASGAGTEASGLSLPTAQQLTDLLEPFRDVDYPTEALFRKALEVAHCGYYVVQLELIARARSQARTDGKEVEIDRTCPPKPPPTAATGSSAHLPSRAAAGVGAHLPAPSSAAADPAAPLSLPAFHQALLPAAQIEAIVAQARKSHRHDGSFVAGWYAQDGCGCVRPRPEDEVHAFVPYWGTTEQQQARAPRASGSAPAAPQTEDRRTDLSVFTRLNFMGAVLNDLGDAELPRLVNEAGQRLSHEALRHGSRVNLVVYRNDWGALLKQPKEYLEALARKGAESTMRHVDERQPNLHRAASALLLPFWREESHSYAGVTVFFDNLPADAQKEAAARFRIFYESFIDNLVERMAQGGRSYHLAIVVPDDRAGDKGLFDFGSMYQRIVTSERAPRSKYLAKEGLDYRGKGDIRVSYVMMLSDPTTRTKKALRARVDQSSEVTGARRVMLLDAMVPLLLRPAALKSHWALDHPGQQYKDDLAYLSWTYGGAAVWELPADAGRDKELLTMLHGQFAAAAAGPGGLCRWVCPNRLWLRLLLQALAAAGTAALVLWIVNCAVRNLGLPYKIFLWVVAFASVPLALALLECDPALEKLNEGHVPLMVLTAALFALGLYWSFRARRERP